MYCDNCGKMIRDDSDFCSECGFKIPKERKNVLNNASEKMTTGKEYDVDKEKETVNITDSNQNVKDQKEQETFENKEEKANKKLFGDVDIEARIRICEIASRLDEIDEKISEINNKLSKMNVVNEDDKTAVELTNMKNDINNKMAGYDALLFGIKDLLKDF